MLCNAICVQFPILQSDALHNLRTTVIIHTSEAKSRQLTFLIAGFRAGWYCSTGYSPHDFLNVESETSHSSIYNNGSYTSLREKQIIIFAITISDSFAIAKFPSSIFTYHLFYIITFFHFVIFLYHHSFVISCREDFSSQWETLHR